MIGCALGTSEDVTSGHVDFADLRLEKTTKLFLWDQLAQKAAKEHFLPKPDSRKNAKTGGWSSLRGIAADLRAELRPSILLLPGESLRFSLRLHENTPLFETGLALWRPALEDQEASAAAKKARAQVLVDGKELWSKTLNAPQQSFDARWHEERIDLAPYAGQGIELTLRSLGELPLVFGAPTLRRQTQRRDRPNVLLISIDMLRSDHVGAYGYDQDTTPNLDRLARENIFFPLMYAVASYTLPATVSMMSGQFPAVHGVYRGTQAVSTKRSPLLASILGAQGYRTMGFTAGGFVSSDFGLNKGFDGFTNVDPLRHHNSEFFHLLRDRNPELTPELIKEHGPKRIASWLEEHREEPFFLFVHTYTVHDYDAPDEYFRCDEIGCTSTRKDYTSYLAHKHKGQSISEADKAHLRHRYDGGLRYTDHLLGDLFAKLKELGLYDDTLLIVTSDHGEEMFERGVIQHGKTLYEELTRIPLIIKAPGRGPKVVELPAMTIDIAPTVLAALGLPPESRMQGKNLLSDELDMRVVLSEIDDSFAHKYAVRDGQGFKLIHSPREREVPFPGPKEWELYDTRNDPFEREEKSALNKERFEVLRAALLDRIGSLKKLGKSLGEVGAAAIDDQTQKELDLLGY